MKYNPILVGMPWCLTNIYLSWVKWPWPALPFPSPHYTQVFTNRYICQFFWNFLLQTIIFYWHLSRADTSFSAIQYIQGWNGVCGGQSGTYWKDFPLSRSIKILTNSISNKPSFCSGSCDECHATWNFFETPLRFSWKFLKGNMHHKHDASSKDSFYVTDIAAWIYFENFAP